MLLCELILTGLQGSEAQIFGSATKLWTILAWETQFVA